MTAGLRLEQVTPDNVRDACRLELRPGGLLLAARLPPTGELNQGEVAAELLL